MRPSRPLYCVHLLINLSTFVWSQKPEPVSVTFGSQFLGYDGSWSPVSIRAGTPQQWLSLFPNTLSSETWLAGETYCSITDQTCITLRGGIFLNGSSTTWQSIGEYEMGYSELLQETPTAPYGLDVLALSDTLSASGQIIALVDDINHWIGNFGLNVQNSRFSGDSNSLPFLSTLVQNLSVVPSHSYGYSAGASYYAGGVAGSLTFGGVDTSRYQDSKTWFALSAGYTPTVSLQSIQVTAASAIQQWANNPLQLMTVNQAATFIIDSSTPFLWLPESVCDSFASALNLTWNSTINLYTFGNGTTLQTLLNQELTFTFTIAGISGPTNIDLTLSFNAFNLQLSYPFPNLFDQYTDERVNYFPLRRTNNAQQYTIGRAFLQETYLIVDYERNVFSLNQAVFPTSSTQSPQLAAIARPKDSTWPGPVSSDATGLSTGVKAGIAVGVVVVLLVTLVGILVFLRNRKRKRSGESLNDDRSKLLSIFSKRSTVKSRDTDIAAELQADKRHPTELVSDKTNSRFELSTVTPFEMPGGEVPPSFFQERVNTTITQRNDPRSPVELIQPPSRSSISKDRGDQDHDLENQSSAPPYSPVDANQRYSSSFTPNSNTRRSNQFSNVSDRVISPLTGSDSDRGEIVPTGRSGGSDSLSPVSPMVANGDHERSKTSSTSRSTNHLFVPNKTSPQSTLSPASAVHYTRRSSSQDSRFREDLNNSDHPQSPERQHMQQPHASAGLKPGGEKRFSWE